MSSLALTLAPSLTYYVVEILTNRVRSSALNANEHTHADLAAQNPIFILLYIALFSFVKTYIGRCLCDADQIQFRAFLLLRLIAQLSTHLRSIAPTTTNDRRTWAQESILSEEATDDRGSIVQSSAHLRLIAPLTAIDRTRGPYANFMRFILFSSVY